MTDKLYLYNYRTGEHEFIETPSDFADYIPQSQSAQSLYKLYQQAGDTPIQAAVKVLLISAGEHAPQPGGAR